MATRSEAKYTTILIDATSDLAAVDKTRPIDLYTNSSRGPQTYTVNRTSLYTVLESWSAYVRAIHQLASSNKVKMIDEKWESDSDESRSV